MDLLGRSYRLTKDLPAVDLTDEFYKRILLPKGETVTVVTSPYDGVAFAHARWRDRQVVMFGDDLRQHAERIDDATTAG